MSPNSQPDGASRWQEITPSQWRWEREALDFLRGILPTHEPYRAWTNFEFLASDGSINEVDALVLTPKGCFLIEIKSWPGAIRGDWGEWIWIHDGRRDAIDNPLPLANKKAKRLKGVLEQHWPRDKQAPPFVSAVIFLSADGIDSQLDLKSIPEIVTRKDVFDFLCRIPPEQTTDPRRRIDKPIARQLGHALEKAGIRPRKRRVGDYTLTTLLHDGPTLQEWEGAHASVKNVKKRLRLYKVACAASAEMRGAIRRAAEREFRVLQGIEHPGILRAEYFAESEVGPALVFDRDPNEERLDRFVRARGDRLTFDQRLGLLRQVAEAIAFAHGQKLVHRALAPSSVLVRGADSNTPRTLVFNWQTSAKHSPGSSHSSLAATSHVAPFLDDGAAVFLAPEVYSAPDTDSESLDVFSLGSLAWFLFTGKAPADSPLEVPAKLKADGGLRLERELSGVTSELSDLIRMATHPDVSQRLETVAEFLLYLDEVEDSLTKPAATFARPIDATKGDRLEGGYTVEARLGSGSSAIAYLAKRDMDGKSVVLKVALDREHNDRLRGEGEILKKLRHPSIVAIHEVVEIGGHVALVLDRAGSETLAQRLRTDGALQPDLLERFGRDLIEALHYIETEGVVHRDLKPENLGIVPRGKNDELHLMLFDFSLSRAPAEATGAGTKAYLDPFLGERKVKRFDLHAERFAAAMTLHEMATGVLPRWGDGESHPAALECEVTIEAERFPAGQRPALARFFSKALARSVDDRFGNAEEMLKEWRGAFHVAVKSIDEQRVDDATRERALATATLDSTIGELLLSTRAQHALDRANVNDARGFLRLHEGELWRMRGVGTKTRGELLSAYKKLRERFPTDSTPAAQDDRKSVDAIVRRLVPAGEKNAILRRVLALEPVANAKVALWPSLVEVARAVGKTQPTVGIALSKQREGWSKLPIITELRDELIELLDAHAGVMTTDELIDAILLARGCDVQGLEDRRRYGAAAVRAAIETEKKLQEPRLVVERSGSLVFVARDGHGRPCPGSALVAAARALGDEADRIVHDSDPLLAPESALSALRAIYWPIGVVAPSPQRLARLAVSVSSRAALSSRLEIYPRRMAADRAMRLAHGALVGAFLSKEGATEAEIEARVRARYPDCAALPSGPQLEAILRDLGFDVVFDPAAAGGQGAWKSKTKISTISSDSKPSTRQPTMHDGRPPPTEEVAEARGFEERLSRAKRDGAFLVLAVSPRYASRLEKELRDRFEVDVRSFDELFIAALRRQAESLEADWNVVLAADTAPPDSEDGRRLRELVGRALAEVETTLSRSENTIVLTNLGLLARYSRLDMVDRLRERVAVRPTKDDPGLFGLWLVVPCSNQTEAPSIDGQAVPVITRAQWARVPGAWLRNEHRSARPIATANSKPMTSLQVRLDDRRTKK